MLRTARSSGLSFRKLDLHVHTPASKDFQGTATPDDIVDEAIRKGLDGIAITDHNTAAWVDKVRDAAKGTTLTVFPGVEISCAGGQSGIHVIALFDPTKDEEHLKGVLSNLGITPANQGKSEALVSDKTLQQVIDTIQDSKWGGLAILAHVNSSKGIFKDMGGQHRIRVIRHPSLLAVEATDCQDEEKRKKRKRVIDLLDGTDTNYQRKLAVYQASDNPNPLGHGHILEGIGTRFSYFKLEQINLEGLRQCFCDPDVRIRQNFESTTWNYPYIKKIKITGGFLDGQEIDFHTGLNSILGAKGTGKSLLIELLRFGLGQPPTYPEIKRDHISKLDIRLGEFSYIELWFVNEVGKETYLKRTYNSPIDSPFDVTFDPAQIFPVLFLSQNEIINIAESEQEQLTFIDTFFNFKIYKTQIADLEKELERLDKQMADGLRAFAEYEGIDNDISTLRIEVEKLDEALKHPIFQRYSQARQKTQTFSEQTKYIQILRESISNTEARSNRILPVLPDEIKNDPALRRNQASLSKAQQALELQLQELDRVFETHQVSIENEWEQWKPSHAVIRKDYDTLVQEKGGNYQALATQREQKTRKLDELIAKLSTLQKRKDSTGEIQQKRNDLLDELERVYRSYTSERQAKCNKFQVDSGGKLQLRIMGSSNIEEFKRQLLQLKQGSYLRENEIDAICSKLKPRELIISLLRFNSAQAGKLKDADKHLKSVSEQAGIELARMVKLANFLTEAIEPERLLALQYKAHPQDRPEIRFNIGDGVYELLNLISIGQKSTALLMMALSNGDMPIVIDQPEDSLDIRSIWDDICLKLRDGKERRQFIFTTHNSSVAVASDTDYFIILEGNSTRGRIVFSGSMDHAPVSDEVLKYLEGGVSTYKRKYLKYRGDERLNT